MVVIILLIPSIINGQAMISNSDNKNLVSENNHQETVYLHHNKSLLFAGEQLYYKVYALKSESNTLSTFSKMAYVELIGENGELVFRHKIRLKNGVGQGEFFIPVTVPSGNYKLIGYTQWMKNFGLNHFYKSDIGLINPFQSNQEAIVQNNQDSIPPSTKTTEHTDLQENLEPNPFFSFELSKKEFRTRERGSLIVRSLQKGTPKGSYSISIRKVDSLGGPQPSSAQLYVKKHNSQSELKHSSLNPNYLPELRGELISGTITPKDPSFAMEEEEMALSIPGKQFVLKLTRTNSAGEFYFNLNQAYLNSKAYVQILGENRDKYNLQITEQPAIDYGAVQFNKLQISPKMTDLILKRSVHNQVENAFIELKQDTIMPIIQTLPIYRTFSKIYDLDDYTRFSTVRETASEVLEHVWVSKQNDGQEVLKVRSGEDDVASNLLPLVLMDGLLIQNHSDVIDFDAKRIKRIHISREDCVVNSIIYNGIIAMETLEGSFPGEFSRDYIKDVELFAPLPIKKYFNQKYQQATRPNTDQIPDFREQLLWLPQVVLESDTPPIEFYTSDVVGNYEVSFEGFTEQGNPISWKETFVVK
ncbi:hypothetical protein [Flagellimonas sp.]|uniref:hypothetical protein n=1 Tax=Flagellimonas sp. TaxID=2058762 RepID=UPI003B52D640